jgi:transposase
LVLDHASPSTRITWPVAASHNSVPPPALTSKRLPPLRQLIPDDHVLVRVDRVLDLSWLRDEVADCYCLDDGRPGIDPEAAVRLMLAGLLSGIVHDRRLMREAQVNLAIRWFAGYALHEKLPDHSSLTRIRQRRGPERFNAVLSRTVKACLAARIATGEVVHLDATLIRADRRSSC